MSLNVHVYTLLETGKHQTVRSIDYKSVMASWVERKLSPEERTQEIVRLVKDTESWRTLAGPEDWRTQVYGSLEAKALGLSLLPSLAHRNIDVQGSELDRLAWEIDTLIQNVALLPSVAVPIIEQLSGTKTLFDSMLSRFQNIANAAAEAKQLNGGVEIS